jgi:hypothetical protein
MTSDSTTQARWPLPGTAHESGHWRSREREPAAQAARRPRRKLPRFAWLLIGLAFICGGLVSAAGFSIGWRHQAQRNTAAETALRTATAQVRALQASLGDARLAAAREHRAATATAASERSLVGAAAKVGSGAAATSDSAASVSSGAGSLTGSAARIASELKTFSTYLTTTPSGQLDPGYIASQTAYLTRQLTRLQAAGGTLGDSIASFEAAVRKLTQDAAAVKPG